MDAYDAVVESALAVEAYAIEKGYDTELLFVDRQGDFQRIQGPVEGRYHDLMTRIPRIGAGTGSEMLRLLSAETQSVRCQNNLVICTSSLNERVVDACAAIAGPSRFPFLIGVVGSGDDGDARKAALARLRASNLPFALISHAGELAGGAR